MCENRLKLTIKTKEQHRVSFLITADLQHLFSRPNIGETFEKIGKKRNSWCIKPANNIKFEVN